MEKVNRYHPNAKLIMVGGGELKDYLKNLSMKLGIEKNVLFTGRLKYDEIPKVLSTIDIFVMPSICESETFGVSAIEAQAMQIPVVASKIGGIPEAVKDGETGLLVGAKDVTKLADAIIKLIENPNLRAKMGIAGRKYVLENYNLDNNFILLEQLYYNMLKKRK